MAQFAAVVATATAAAPICTTVLATATDPAMQWHCQGRGVARCTGKHIACSPAGPGKGLVIFLPGTYLQPSDYSGIVAEFAHHGFHSMGLFCQDRCLRLSMPHEPQSSFTLVGKPVTALTPAPTPPKPQIHRPRVRTDVARHGSETRPTSTARRGSGSRC